MRLREGNQQDTHAQYDPGFIGIPERPDGRHHHILFVIAGEGQQHADAQIVAIENHIDKQCQPHGASKEQRKPVSQIHHASPSAVSASFMARC